MGQRLAKKILLIGWDAADWKIISPMVDAGQLPALSALIDSGCVGNIATLQPPLSPILWSSIVTGKRAFKHGIRGFLEPTEEAPGVRPVSSTSRTCKAIWNICHQSGMNTHAIGFFASHPAEPIRGVCVSNQFFGSPPEKPKDDWTMPADAVHPSQAFEAVRRIRVHPAEISPNDLKEFIPELEKVDCDADRRPDKLASILAKAASVQAVATSILENEPWDLVAVYFEAIDVASHHFMPYHPPRMPNVSQKEFDLYSGVIAGMYRFHDMMLGRLMELAGDEATIILLSDHGFHCDHLRPLTPPTAEAEGKEDPDAAWHRPLGTLCIKGPHIRSDERIYGASLLDITPTILHLFGLPIGQDMDGKVLASAIDEPVVVERIESWETVTGDAGLHPPEKRQQAFDHAAMLEHLVELGYIDAPSEDVKKNADVAVREGNYNLAISYMEAGRPDEAIKLLDPIYAASPHEPRFATPLAQCHHLLGRIEKTSEIIERLIAENGSTPDAELLLGAVRFNMGRKDEALDSLEKLAMDRSPDPRVHAMLGSMYSNLRRFPEAIDSLNRALAIDDSNAETLDNLSYAFLMTNQFEEAADAALRAVGITYYYPLAHLHLGMALMHMKEFKRAIGPLELAVTMQPKLVDGHRYLATAHRELLNWDLARKHRNAAEDLLNAARKAGQQVHPPHAG